jgi:hypothetical protein
MTSSRLKAVLTAIDNINSEDPNQTMIDGISQPNELLYGQYMTNCIEQYFPQSNELLQIAVRAQHIKRWDLKRTAFAAKYTEKDNEAKIIRIVQKTWGKMSDRGHEIALSLTLPDHLAALVGKALA